MIVFLNIAKTIRAITNNKYLDKYMCTYSSLRGPSSHKHKIWKKIKEGQKLYNWLHLTAGRAMIFLLTLVGPRRATKPVFGVSDKARLKPVLFVCFVALRPKSTAIVMAGRSVHLTTLFPGQA